MHPDAWVLLAARVLRNFAYGYLVVVLGIYLDLLGLSPFEIGAVLTASAAGSAFLTIGWSLFADRLGRRRAVSGLAVLMAVGGLVFVVTSEPWLLALAAFAGSLSAAGTDTGTFVTVDQAVLPQISSDRSRTWMFALQNMFATLAVAFGSLSAGAVGIFEGFGLPGADAYRPLFIVFAIIGLCSLALFLRLSPAVEVEAVDGGQDRPPTRLGLGGSHGLVGTLVVLNVIDSLAGGLMLQSIVAYWFYLAWGLDTSALALLFFWMNILAGLSTLSAGWIARHIGLMNTVLLSHVPQGLFGMLMPFAPTAGLAVALWLARNSIGLVHFPARLSYFMAIVPPADRSAAAGYMSVARSAASSITPAFAGAAFSLGFLGLPFVVAGLMKLGFDGLLFVTMRHRQPPEEIAFAEISIPVGAPSGD